MPDKDNDLSIDSIAIDGVSEPCYACALTTAGETPDNLSRPTGQYCLHLSYERMRAHPINKTQKHLEHAL